MKKLPVLVLLALLPIVLLSLLVKDLKHEKAPLEERSKGLSQDPVEIKYRFIGELSSYQPDVLLLGNSMLGRGVNHKIVESVINRKVSKMGVGGTSSVWWYLVTKNIVVPHPNKPKVMVLFFRDHFLTHPSYMLNSAFRLLNEHFYDGEEPLVEQLSYNKASQLYRTIPIYEKKNLLQNQVTGSLKQLVSHLGNVSQYKLQKTLNGTFDEDQMIEELITAQQLKAAESKMEQLFDFESQVNRSYLPHIIRLTKENDIQLILVRTKRRRDVLGEVQPEKLINYMSELNDYLQKQGVPLMDYTNNETITIDWYAEADHLSQSGMNEFSKKLFANDLKKVLMELGI